MVQLWLDLLFIVISWIIHQVFIPKLARQLMVDMQLNLLGGELIVTVSIGFVKTNGELHGESLVILTSTLTNAV